MNDIKNTVLNQMLDTKQGLPFAARAVLRTQLGMPAETNAPPPTISTNAIAPAVLPSSTNSPATNSAANNFRPRAVSKITSRQKFVTLP